MQFRVPKFLEREATIAFGLTFKKLAVVGAAALFLFFLYYLLPKVIFFAVAVLATGIVFAFMFLKVKGQSLFSVLSRSLSFFFSARTYFWQKKQGVGPMKFVKKREEKKESSILKLAPRSRLHEIKSKIDLGP